MITDRDALMAKLDLRWRWLDAHPGHPLFTEREDALLADLAEYERREDEVAAWATL